MQTLAGFRRHHGYDRWLRWTEWPLVALGLLFVVILVVPLAETLTVDEQRFVDRADIAIWLLFAFDYFLRLYLSPERLPFIRSHVLDLVVIAVPFLRPFRLLRLLAIVISTSRRAGGLAVRRVTLYVVGVAVIVTTVGAVLVYDAEKETPAATRTINTLGDSMWWAISTVTTVGYGDVYPRTPIGRLVASGLMIVGIALIGTITAAVASWFVNIVRTASTADNEEDASDEREELIEEVRALTVQLNELRAEVRAIGTPGHRKRRSSQARRTSRRRAPTVPSS